MEIYYEKIINFILKHKLKNIIYHFYFCIFIIKKAIYFSKRFKIYYNNLSDLIIL